MKTIIGLGEILWDVFLENNTKTLGGAPANFAYIASRLGFNSYAVSAIGKDSLGKEIVNVLEEKKFNYILEEVDFPTGTVEVQLDSKGVAAYEICRNVAWDNIPFTKQMEEIARNCQAVCFGSLAQRNKVSRDTIYKFLDMVPKESYVIFDINLRQNFYTKEVIEESLDRCNVFKLNEDEILVVKKMLLEDESLSENETCRLLIEKYKLNILILTKGETESVVYVKESLNNPSVVPTEKESRGDTVGAGDSFTSAFICALLRGKTISEAHHLAVTISSFVCSQKGAMPDLPDNITSKV